MFAGDMYSEQKRLKELPGKLYRHKATGVLYRIKSVSRNIYGDVCYALKAEDSHSHNTIELIEDSVEHTRDYEEVNECMPQ